MRQVTFSALSFFTWNTLGKELSCILSVSSVLGSVVRFVVRDFAFLTNFAGFPATSWAGPPAGIFSEGKIEFSLKRLTTCAQHTLLLFSCSILNCNGLLEYFSIQQNTNRNSNEMETRVGQRTNRNKKNNEESSCGGKTMPQHPVFCLIRHLVPYSPPSLLYPTRV